MPIRKLTLSAPEDVIDAAKRVAARDGTSVSAMFTRLLSAAASSDDDPVIGPVTLRATGVTTLPDDRSDRELLEEALVTRYLDGD
jgi:hypothetical protein